MLTWHSPQKEGVDNETLQLAKIKQLPQLLRQQVDEETRNKEEIEVMRREIMEILTKQHKVQTNLVLFLWGFFFIIFMLCLDSC